MTTYEQQLEIVEDLQLPSTPDERYIRWCLDGAPVGFALTPAAQIEIFLRGPALDARFERVRQATEHQRWFRSDGDELLANRILLPGAGHFDKMAALISTDLMRNGGIDDLPSAFATTEPLIDLAIGELLLAQNAFLGLCGEMLLLRTLLEAAPPSRNREVLDAWHGYRETPRDFQLGFVGVEVKTTTSGTSSHQFEGIHQLELGHGVDGTEEDHFYLCSVGLDWVVDGKDESTTTLPEIVEALLARMQETLGPVADNHINSFIRHISEYGLASELGYDHARMSEFARFNSRFSVRFVRCYDMTDNAIKLLTTDDMHARPFIERDSLRLRINLPDYVGGDLNPIDGLGPSAKRILASAGLAAP